MKHVLIVDDDSANRYYLNSLFTGHGFAVESAIHGADALAKARANFPDIIVSDLLMPVMDGYTLLSHWKADENLKKTPFVVYTATYTDASDERLAVDLGADAFIVKGVAPEYLLDRVREVLQTAASGATSLPTQQDVADSSLLNQYSAILVNKLEQRNLQLEASSRALEREGGERVRIMTTLNSILDALPAHIALLDSEGVIEFVNSSWRGFARENLMATPDYCRGANYLTTCLNARGDCSEGAYEVFQGIQKVLQRHIPAFSLDYPCHSPSEKRWFRMMATPWRDPSALALWSCISTSLRESYLKLSCSRPEIK